MNLLSSAIPDSLKEKIGGKRGRGQLYYGWIIMIAVWWILLIAYGTRFYSFPVFFPRLLTAFGWTRAQTSVPMSVSTFLYGAFGIFLGPIFPRTGVRLMITWGCIIAAIGFVLIPMSGDLLQFTIFYSVIMTFGIASMAFVPTTAALTAFFVKRRGTAIGIANTGIGFGGATLGAIVASILLAAYGWQGAFYWLGGIVLICGTPVAIFVLRTRPEDMGLLPDGAKPGAAAAATPGTPAKPARKILTPEEKGPLLARRIASYDFKLGEAIKTPSFWCIAIWGLCVGLVYNGLVQHQVVFALDMKISSVAAAGALALVLYVSIAGRFFYGWLGDIIDKNWCCVLIGLMGLISALSIMMIKGPEDIVWLYVYAVFCGLLVAFTPVLMGISGDRFGRKNVASNYGVLLFFLTCGTGTGPFMAGLIYDATKSYQMNFTICAVVSVVAMVCAFLARPVKAPKKAATPAKA